MYFVLWFAPCFGLSVGFRISAGLGLDLSFHPNWYSSWIWVLGLGYEFGCSDTTSDPNPTHCHPCLRAPITFKKLSPAAYKTAEIHGNGANNAKESKAKPLPILYTEREHGERQEGQPCCCGAGDPHGGSIADGSSSDGHGHPLTFTGGNGTTGGWPPLAVVEAEQRSFYEDEGQVLWGNVHNRWVLEHASMPLWLAQLRLQQLDWIAAAAAALAWNVAWCAIVVIAFLVSRATFAYLLLDANKPWMCFVYIYEFVCDSCRGTVGEKVVYVLLRSVWWLNKCVRLEVCVYCIETVWSFCFRVQSFQLRTHDFNLEFAATQYSNF